VLGASIESFNIGACKSNINPNLHEAEITIIFFLNVAYLATDLFIT
jgi:hypothetical protein